MKDLRTPAASRSAASLVAVAILALGASVAPLRAQSIPVAPIVSLNTLNWSASAGFGSTAPGWYKEVGLVDPDVVHLQGAVKQTSAIGSDANLIGILPPAASPNRVVYSIVHTFNGTYADIAINPNGHIVLIDPRPPAVRDYSFVSLEGITYEQFLPVGGPINPNTYWSADAGFGSSAPAWYQDGSFDVHLQGAERQTFSSASNVFGTIISAAPQNRVIYTIVHTFNGTYADVAINPNGQIALIDPRPPAVKDYLFVSLEGITYGSGLGGVINSFLSVNTTNWSTSAGFGSAAPGWYKDASGIVHLVGAAKQTAAGSNLLGTLPVAARPNRVVYTIVHTFNGTYADIAINPNGQIGLIDPRPPAVKDYSFVSLECITYQQ